MYITFFTDYDNMTDEYNKKNIEVIPLITVVPCGTSLVCLISLMVCTLIKPLIRKNKTFPNK